MDHFEFFILKFCLYKFYILYASLSKASQTIYKNFYAVIFYFIIFLSLFINILAYISGA